MLSNGAVSPCFQAKPVCLSSQFILRADHITHDRVRAAERDSFSPGRVGSLEKLVAFPERDGYQ